MKCFLMMHLYIKRNGTDTDRKNKNSNTRPDVRIHFHAAKTIQQEFGCQRTRGSICEQSKQG